MTRKEWTGNAASAVLTAQVLAGGTTFQIDDATGWPVGTYPFVATAAKGTASEEKTLFSGRSGTVLTVSAAPAGRGWDGTLAVQHEIGETLDHTIDADTFTDLSRHVYDTTSDDHTQYLNIIRHDVEARHTFGAAFGTPATPAAVATTASAGSGGVPAREDHVHILAAGVAGDGLALTAGVLSVNVDGSTLEVVTDTLQVKNGGIIGVKLAPAVAGVGLVQDGSGNLDVNVDGSTLEVVTDIVRVKDAGITTAKLVDDAVTDVKLDPSIPLGRVGSALRTTNQTGITAETDITSMTTTFTAVSGRYYYITAKVVAVDESFECNYEILLNVGGSNVDTSFYVTQGGSFNNVSHPLAFISSSLSGAVTAKLRARRSAGSGTIKIFGNASVPMTLMVQDLGT